MLESKVKKVSVMVCEPASELRFECQTHVHVEGFAERFDDACEEAFGAFEGAVVTSENFGAFFGREHCDDVAVVMERRAVGCFDAQQPRSGMGIDCARGETSHAHGIGPAKHGDLICKIALFLTVH